GSAPGDFVLVANRLDGRMRSVGFQQTHRGLPVLGGQISVRFVRDRAIVIASTAWPALDVRAPATPVSDARAAAAAGAWIASIYGGAPVAGAVDSPAVLPLAGADGSLVYRAVVRVQVDLESPRGRWDVWLDAATAAPVARRQRLMFASATMTFDAPERWWGSTRHDYPAMGAGLTVGGNPVTADDAGLFSWTGTGTAAVIARARGPLVRVFNKAGADASWTTSASGGDTLTWSAADDELVDAQITAYVHAQIVKQWARTVSDIPFLDGQQETNVNINDTCNAFSDGTAINFYASGDGCGNTGRIADIVYHEFGHSLHEHALIAGVGSWDGALSEGLGDFVAATLIGDPDMGRGFFGTDEPLRSCDPQGMEYMWPDDVGEVHDTGRIYCGAMYDLRKNLVALLGEDQGVGLTNELFYESFRRADDIPSTYVELLAWDDDDGNLDNGTPHHCEIDDAYARHGLAEAAGDAGPRVSPPTLEQLTVTLPTSDSQICSGGNITGAALEWRLRADPSVTGMVPMDAISGGFQAAIPPAPAGSVVQYRVIASQQAGAPVSFPTNRADPWYELFVGDVQVLYCTDFEVDPAGDGWTHELVSGDAGEGADDWQWGTPNGQNGDPRTAYSGASVYGNDLGPDGWNGQYQNGKFNRTTMPVVDTQGLEIVRLQYRRWLGVEDGSADHARITANGTEMWSNLADAGQTHHLDGEW
ncbi:MAG TPA: hypothetical protein VL172_21295, partial [Kofleriaceae bacterium]|nr:hypothetical protein [Kofleriaceae bacterium]